MKPPHSPEWTAAFDQALKKPCFREQLLAYAKRKARWAWKYGDIDDSAAELVQDALERTLDGRRPWNPDARALLDHLRGVIRSRSSQHYEHAKRFRVAEINPRDHLSPTEDDGELEDRADETFAAIVRLAIHDPQVSLLLDAYTDGLLLRADVLARTGLTDQQYEAARDRLARMRDTLPNRLVGIGAKHFPRSGR